MTAVTDYLRAVRETARSQATEHSYRPHLKALLEALRPGAVATNEPRHRRDCGAPDMSVADGSGPGAVTIGYVECKDIGTHLDEVEQSEQLTRYRDNLDNLVLTDYLEFRWYVEGEERGRARLAHVDAQGKLVAETGGATRVEDLLTAFLSAAPEPIRSPAELARRMARLTRMIRDIIVQAFDREQHTDTLHGLFEAFRQTLLPQIEPGEFADMYAQTLAYGLFAARVNHRGPRPFERIGAAAEIPKTNPFLRKLFHTITGPDLDDEPYAGFVDDLTRLLAHADIGAILADFGAQTRRDDPIVHFYETFLAAYDPKLREMRGVYYTPEPVVSYIVRSVDWILREHFDLPDGLADRATVTYEVEQPDGTREQRTSPRVLILDPACGTGTFLYHVIDHIRRQFVQSNNAGMWPGFVREQLLPRLFGFELLMAPYAVAHLKLGMQLAAQDMTEAQRERWAYDFDSDERLGVYLTNTLEEAESFSQMQFGLMQTIAEEANAAAEVKRDMPIMVVLGNPPYSSSSQNQNDHIDWLMDAWKTTVRREETQLQALSNDFAKFLRYAEWHVEKTGVGVVAMITANSFLQGPLFRDMRAHLTRTMDEIYLLDLHGKARESSPDGGPDDSVFDIKDVGVCISVWVRTEGHSDGCTVHHAELWGSREGKERFLTEHSVSNTAWDVIDTGLTGRPWALRDAELQAEWEAYMPLPEVFGSGDPAGDQHRFWGTGFVTQQDAFAIAFSQDDFGERIAELLAPGQTEEALRAKYRLCTTQQWDFEKARAALSSVDCSQLVTACLYRPFDVRYTVYSRHVATILRRRIMDQLRGRENLALLTTRRGTRRPYSNAFVTRNIPEYKSTSHDRNTQVFPLYVFTDVLQGGLLPESERLPNLSPRFLRLLEERMRLPSPPCPEDVFHYVYAILHSPTYRSRYAEALELTDFPRVPLTSDADLFRDLVALGGELVALHLMESPELDTLMTSYPVAGDNLVEKGHPKYVPPGEVPPGEDEPAERGRVYINRTKRKAGAPAAQYFDGVPPEVWEFQVGGYQVPDKWLKDRRGRELTPDDLTHYQRIVVALARTIEIMAEIDARIEEWPIQ